MNNRFSWRRLFARIIDYSVAIITGSLLVDMAPFWVLGVVLWGLMATLPVWFMGVEAVCLRLWGRTPGRALMGIVPVGKGNWKVSFQEAVHLRMARDARKLSWLRWLVGVVIAVGGVFIGMSGEGVARLSVGLDRPLSDEGWTQYVHQEGGFKVHFPDSPEETAKQLEVPHADQVFEYQEITAQQKRVQYSVTYMELPRKWKLAGSNIILKGVLDLLVQYTPNTALKNKELINHQSHRALDFYLQQDGQEVHGRLILVGTTLYKLTVSYPAHLAEELKDDPFLESFDLYLK